MQNSITYIYISYIDISSIIYTKPLSLALVFFYNRINDPHHQLLLSFKRM